MIANLIKTLQGLPHIKQAAKQLEQIVALASEFALEPLGPYREHLPPELSSHIAYLMLQRHQRGEQGVMHLLHSGEGSSVAYLGKDDFLANSGDAFREEELAKYRQFLDCDSANWLLLAMWPGDYTVIYLQLSKLPGGEE